MNLAKAFANNDVVLLVWHYDHPIPDCLGFCIKRKNIETGKTDPLFSMVGFKKESIQTRQFMPTTIWPIQKFNWRDFMATSGETYEYTIIPMTGTQTNLQQRTNLKLTTNEVTLSPGKGRIKSYFNKGILATQYLANEVPKSASGIPNYAILQDRIKQPGDALRNKLADELRPAILDMLDKAIKENGQCYLSLYELNDPELVQKLHELGDRVHIILANTGADDKTNEVARVSLHNSDINVIDRFVPSGHIGHNKFIIYVNKDGVATNVLTGSTNWTHTGLCAQTNNALIIRDNEVAAHYMDYWKRLKNDKAEQGATFRKDNNSERKATIASTAISIWFSPNTKIKNKTATSPAPDDIAMVFDLMDKAKRSILFLAFQPGTPSIIDQAAKVQEAKPDLFIRGAATDLAAIETASLTLYHRGVNEPVFIGAQEIKDDFSYWMAELLKSSPMAHAVIHDKVLVIDAFTPDCVVITGSHNLGYRASYNNDENMVIIKGHPEVATAYATHILDVYDHYRWRYFLSKNSGSNQKFTGLRTDPSWQDVYFNTSWGESIDTRFWI